MTESLAVTEKILTNLRPGVKYEVQVRIKLDGISYDGYWSAWSTGVFMETPPAGEYSLYTSSVSALLRTELTVVLR